MTDNTKVNDNAQPAKEITLTKERLKQLNNDFFPWASFLNNVIGVLAFTLSVGSLGTNDPLSISMLSTAFVLMVYFKLRPPLPKLIVELREKEDKTQREDVTLKGIESQMMGFKNLFSDYLIFTTGLAFLLGVVVVTFLSQDNPFALLEFLANKSSGS